MRFNLSSPFVKQTLVAAMAATTLSVNAATTTVDPTAVALTDQLILPAFDRFQSSAAALEQQAKQFCSAPSEQGLQQTQQQWQQAMDSWQAIYPFNFDPSFEGDMTLVAFQIDSKMMRGRNFSVAVDAMIENMMDDPSMAEPGFVGGLKFKFKGVLALEHLLFKTRGGKLGAAEIVAEYQKNPGKCSYLTLIGSEVSGLSQEVQRIWKSGATSFKQSENARPWLINKSIETVAFTAQRKLEPSMAGGDSAESWVSKTSLHNLRTNLTAVHQIFYPKQGSGYGAELAQKDTALEQRLSQQFSELLELLGQMESKSINQWLAEDRHTLESLHAEIITLEKILKHEVTNALGITLGFNFNDGD